MVCGGHDLRSPCGMGCRGTRKLIEFEKDALIHSVVGPFTMENKDEGEYMKKQSLETNV